MLAESPHQVGGALDLGDQEGPVLVSLAHRTPTLSRLPPCYPLPLRASRRAAHRWLPMNAVSYAGTEARTQTNAGMQRCSMRYFVKEVVRGVSQTIEEARMEPILRGEGGHTAQCQQVYARNERAGVKM
jgi:hypothetical protein